jgi:hypothetical protein
MQTVHVGMHMRVNQARHQGCAPGIDDGCTGWHRAANRMDVRAVDRDCPVFNDMLPVKYTRLDDGGDRIRLLSLV